MGKLKLDDAPLKTGSIYPEPFASQMAGRSSLRLGDLGGLTQFGANLVILEPGAKSSLRHWHENEDEFVMVTMGTCTLVDDDGAHEMQVGDCAAFPAMSPNAHHFINNTDKEARFLVVGSRKAHENAHYPDDRMKVEIRDGKAVFTGLGGEILGETA